MKKIAQLFLLSGIAGVVVLLIGVFMQQPLWYKPAAVFTAVCTAIGLGAVPALKGYRYTAWIIVAVVAGIATGNNPVVWLVGLGIAFAMWIAFALYLLYQRLGVEYQLTTQRLFHRKGILARVTNRVEVIDIDDVQFSQNLVERFFGVGTIRILSTDISDPKLVMVGIDDVKNVADTIDKVRRDERRRRGLHIETV